MSNQIVAASHYAVLIGIDAYPSSPLTSCVRDVQKIRQCLERNASRVDIQIDIQTLTASKSLDPEIITPLEEPDSWPTCHNVTSALERVTSRAERGSFVYIHFSGHGTRLTPCFDFSNQSTGDLALCLLKGNNSREEFLRGPRLAGLVNAMVDKGLVITLVWDCCFSGSVYRNGNHDTRYLPCELVTTLTYPENNLGGYDTRSLNRDASMRDNWLLDPDRYAILAACGPHESSKSGAEISERGKRYGALSYFLFNALSNHGLTKTIKDIHRHLHAKFRESCVRQNPMLYGNENQGFFGRVGTAYRARSVCVVEHNGELHLLAGKAHGVCEGDRYALAPPGLAQNLGAQEDCTASVACAGPLTSKLKPVATGQNPQTRWIAMPRTCFYLTKFSIRLAPDLPHYDRWQAELKERSLGTNIDTGNVPSLQVVPSNDSECEILGESGQKLINLPAMPRDQTDSRRICDILEHIACFSIIKSLVNKPPTATFQESFSIHIFHGKKQFGPGEQIELQENDVLKLLVENTGQTALYSHVYNLGPCWRVKGILRGSYDFIPPKKKLGNGEPEVTGTWTKKIKMTVPPVMKEYGACEDIIKVFVTSQPTSFDTLELPNLDELPGINVEDRKSTLNDHTPEDWVALNFPIRTVNRPE